MLRKRRGRLSLVQLILPTSENVVGDARTEVSAKAVATIAKIGVLIIARPHQSCDRNAPYLA